MSGAGKVKESRGEKELARLAEDQWQDYQTRFIPLENQYKGQVDRLRDDRTLATGAANADVAQTYDPTIASIEGSSYAGEVNPSSGKAMISLGDATIDRAGAVSKNVNNADQAIEDRYYSGQSNLIALGRGQAVEAGSGYRMSAGLGLAEAQSRAQATQTRNNSYYNAAGTVIGMGTSGYMNKRYPAGNEWANAPGPRQRS